MTSDGTNSYAWDAENRMIKITYPGTNNYSSLVYDGAGRNATIVETVGGSVTSTKQFVWAGSRRCEARNASGTITAQYFGRGEIIGGSAYPFTLDHIGGVREVTNSSGTVQSVYTYSPFGQQTAISQGVTSDFGFAGYYLHQGSGLNMTWFREFNPNSGRWLSRDPLGEAAGINRFAYVRNMPTGRADPLGLKGVITVCAKSTGFGSSGGQSGPGHCWILWAPNAGDTGIPDGSGTYGTWGGDGDGPAGLRHNYSKDVNLTADACASQVIDDGAEAAVAAIIGAYGDMGPAGWTGNNNCCKFAHDAWLAGTKQDLPWQFLSNGSPNTMVTSIKASGP
jgi:RHS repeat-associated protein